MHSETFYSSTRTSQSWALHKIGNTGKTNVNVLAFSTFSPLILTTEQVRAESHCAVAAAQGDLPLLIASALSDDLVGSRGGMKAEMKTATTGRHVTRLCFGEWRHEVRVAVEGDRGHAASVQGEALLKQAIRQARVPSGTLAGRDSEQDWSPLSR